MGNIVAYEEEPIEEHVDSAEKPEEPEELDLSQLSHKMICSVIEKLDYLEYSNFEEVSRLARDVCNSQKFSLIHGAQSVFLNKSSITIGGDDMWESYPRRYTRWHTATAGAARIEAYRVQVNYRISGSRLRNAGNLFRKNRTILNNLTLSEHITFSPEDFNHFLTGNKLEYFFSKQFMGKDFFKYPLIGTIDRININSCGITDDEFVRLECKGLQMKAEDLSARGLNRFLKKWKRKEREISWVSIEFDSSFNTRRFETILEGLEANIIWTPDTHKDSILGPLRFEELPMVETGDAHHLYSIIRSDDIGNALMVRLMMGSFDAWNIQDEAQYLLDLLSADQYYELRKECNWCKEEFCDHRRRYSVQRLKKILPRFYSTIITSFKLAGYLYSIKTCSNLVGGTTYPVQPMTKDQYDRLHHEYRPLSTFKLILLRGRIALFNC